jgi:transcriptional regulator with XRE-family HTH domain
MDNIDTQEKYDVEKIIRKIREMRKQKGYSNDNMAEDLGLSTSAYNKLERNETALTLERFLKIKNILNVPFSDFFDFKGNNYQQQEFKDNSIGHCEVQNLYQENRETLEKLLQSKDEQITLLKSLLEKKEIR